MEILERELEKVAAFRSLKGDELTRRVQHAEAVVDSVLNASKSGTSPSAPSDDELRLSSLEQECNRIAIELTELSKFTRLNYSGFLKVRFAFWAEQCAVIVPVFFRPGCTCAAT